MEQMTYAELRKLALGAARSYLREQGVNPLDATADDALTALDDICRLDCSLYVNVWYQLESDNQTKLFGQEWRRWQRETGERAK